MSGFSANLGFLWADLPLPTAIRAARRAGFAAVECHWPFGTAAGTVRAALEETGLPMLSLNTRPGDKTAGEFGLAAIPGRTEDARAAIAEAVSYAAGTGTENVHVMAGISRDPRAEETFLGNLAHACDLALPKSIGILIEPLNPHDVPGYWLRDMDQAHDIVRRLGRNNLRIIFDGYHSARRGEDVLATFARHRGAIGHVQFAGVPDRGPPDGGLVDWKAVLGAMRKLGWAGRFGAEYRPGGTTEESLAWLADFQSLS